ncbi:hypothetical protein H0H81_004650 [Sphagnurus paluster]|uniref:Globin-sensor domain-containing protein n=1 Tax=Sphagnurus paluster TaxID=117069 RepID=A0A9P7GSA4_9AGAR|nr:hypothetical protein H0H81_004650 [Sphagnurus paluster]
MPHIDPASLKDLPTRIKYLRDFIEFTPADAATLNAAAAAPLTSLVLDAVYAKVFSFDITAAAFIPRHTGYEGATPAGVEELSLDHPQIKFHRNFLAGYIVKLLSSDYEKDASWEYLNKVGLMHTGVAGFAHRCSQYFISSVGVCTDWIRLPYRAKKPGLRVEYVHIGMLLGYIQDILINAILTHPALDIEAKTASVRALNKVRI